MGTWLAVGGILVVVVAGDYALSRSRFGGRVFRFGQDIGFAIRRLFTGR